MSEGNELGQIGEIVTELSKAPSHLGGDAQAGVCHVYAFTVQTLIYLD